MPTIQQLVRKGRGEALVEKCEIARTRIHARSVAGCAFVFTLQHLKNLTLQCARLRVYV